jgi:hypothetical protein
MSTPRYNRGTSLAVAFFFMRFSYSLSPIGAKIVIDVKPG